MLRKQRVNLSLTLLVKLMAEEQLPLTGANRLHARQPNAPHH